MQKLKATALRAMLAAIKSLDTWAGPIKSVAALAEGVVQGGALVGEDEAGCGAGPPAPRWQELERIQADREMKATLQSGIQAFNRNGVKGECSCFCIRISQALADIASGAPYRAGMRLLVQSGAIPEDGSPQAVARFLREHAAQLDKTQVGGMGGGGRRETPPPPCIS